MNASFDQLCRRISDLLQARGRLAVALDGCCASGKTTLARRLARELEADVVPMDDFFLPPKLRMPDRLSQPGGNVHYERFSAQIIDPLLAAKRAGGEKGAPASKRWPVLTWDRFDCSLMDFAQEPRATAGRSLLIIEGAYCMRPEFRAAYDLAFCLSVAPEIQKQRILSRNGPDRWPAFRDRWIPMENRYLDFYRIPELCEPLILQSDGQ